MKRGTFRIAVGLLSVLIPAVCVFCESPASPNAGSQEKRFELIADGGGFKLEYMFHGKKREVPVPKEWLVPPAALEEEETAYVSSFHYSKNVTSFDINGRLTGLHLSSYEIQTEGSAQGAAGRDVFLVIHPKSGKLWNGGLELGVTKDRVRVMGCFSASFHRFMTGDINRDGKIDLGIVREEMKCLSREDESGDRDFSKEPLYMQDPIRWYVFADNHWRREERYDGKLLPKSKELPLIDISVSPVDLVKGLKKNH